MKFTVKKITKKDLARHLECELQCSRRNSIRVINGLFNFIRDNLEQGHRVQLNLFGSFEARHRAGYRGKNPKTGETALVNARRIVIFKPGRGLRNLRPGVK